MIFALSGSDMARLGIAPSRTVTQNSTGRDITFSRIDPTINAIESGYSTQQLISQNRESEQISGLLSSQTQNLIHENLIGLGESSIDISAALNEQVGIREAQRAETFGVINTLGNYIAEINERLSTQTTELGESVIDVSEAVTVQESQKAAGSIFDGLGLPSMQQLKLPLLIAGLAVASLLGWKILK